MMRIAVAVLAVTLLPAAPAAAQTRVEIGLLSCVIEGGAGFIIGSSKELSCTFEPGNGRPTERYVGVVRKLGLDIGVTGKSYVKWVLAPTVDAYSPGALAGIMSGARPKRPPVSGSAPMRSSEAQARPSLCSHSACRRRRA